MTIDPSLYNLCSFSSKMFNDGAEPVPLLTCSVFHLLIILSEKKCCVRSVNTRFYVTSEGVLLFFYL